MSKTIQSTVKLSNSVEIPYLGLGIYQSPPGKETQNAIRYALEAGYRHIDTAKIYSNERDVGEVLQQINIPRKDLFITTKLWNSDHGFESTISACQVSLSTLELDYLDLYLIHWPVHGLRNETWKAMEVLLTQGKCRAIGVSNYTIRHLEELMEECDIVPSVNQVEFHPFLYQSELLTFCRKHNIQLQAYSPLARANKFDDPRLKAIAHKYNKTPAQIMIRWALQHEIVVIPKSINRERIKQNANVFDFEIDNDDMTRLNNLNENLRTCWDPTTAP